MKKKKLVYISTGVIVLAMVLSLPVKFPYSVYGTGKVFAVNEWILGRTEDGRIVSTMKNNQYGVITSYGGKEFQQKDVYNFFLSDGFGKNRYVKKGEKIGYLESNELQTQLITMKGQLDVEKAFLKVTATGEKDQLVMEAANNLRLAGERLDIQRKLFERSKKLYEDSLIAAQEYELAYNNFQLAQIGVDVADAQLKNISTGDKPEQINFVKKRISSLENQISDLEGRLSSLTISAPFSGILQQSRKDPTMNLEVNNLEPIVDLLDTSSYIIIVPIHAKDLRFVKEGDVADLELFSADCMMQATVANIDNGIQVIGGKQAAYVTAVIDKKCAGVMPGTLAQVVIQTDDLSPFQYLVRLSKGLFYR